LTPDVSLQLHGSGLFCVCRGHVLQSPIRFQPRLDILPETLLERWLGHSWQQIKSTALPLME